MQQLFAGQVLGTDRTDSRQRVHQLQRWYVHGERGALRMCDMCLGQGIARGPVCMHSLLAGPEARGQQL